MLSISAVLPGLSSLHPCAPWPVWRGSVAGPVRFAAINRKQAAQLWHKARRWDRETRRPGRHGGIIGRTALATLYALLFDFLNYRTGRCDPSHDAIASKVGCCPRTARTALARLRDLGVVGWLRRCRGDEDEDGRFRLKQETNAYSLASPSQWKGYRDTDPPPPSRDTLGCLAPVPDPIEAAVAELTHGQQRAALTTLQADPGNVLAVALAGLGQAIEAREAGGSTGRQQMPRNTPLCSNLTNIDRFAASEPTSPPLSDNIEAAKAHWLHALLGTDGDG